MQTTQVKHHVILHYIPQYNTNPDEKKVQVGQEMALFVSYYCVPRVHEQHSVLGVLVTFIFLTPYISFR